MVSLIRKSIPHCWMTGDTAEKMADNDFQWLKALWDYLRREWPADLTRLEDLPLLLVQNTSSLAGGSCDKILCLSPHPTCIVMDNTSDMTTIAEALKKLGATVTNSLLDFISQHAAVKDKYIWTYTATNVLSLLANLHGENPEQFLENFEALSKQEKDDFCQLLSKVESSVIGRHLNFLKMVPMFQIVNPREQCTHASVQSVWQIAPQLLPPCELLATEDQMLHITDANVRAMAEKIGARPITTAMVLKWVTTPEANFDTTKLTSLADFVKKNMQQLVTEDKVILSVVGSLSFIAAGGQYHTPRQLFDPRDNILQGMFCEESVFPIEEYGTSDWLEFLHHCGLKTISDVTPNDITRSVEVIQVHSQQHHARMEDKAKSILECLMKRPELLDDEIVTALSEKPWLPVLKDSPAEFPTSLRLYQSPCYFGAPKDLMSLNLMKLVGAVAPVCKIEVPPAVARKLDIICSAEQLPLDKIIAQLKEVIQSYEPNRRMDFEDTAKYMHTLSALYHELAGKEGLQEEMENNGLQEWVWNGEGFSSPSVLCCEELPFDMRPYCYSLPSELHTSTEALLQCGVSKDMNNDLLMLILEKIKTAHEGECPPSHRAAKDLLLCFTILNYVKKEPQEEIQRLQDRLLVPVDTDQVSSFAFFKYHLNGLQCC